MRDEPPQVHDQRFYLGELRGLLELGLSDHFSVELQVPLRVSATTVKYRRLDGTQFEPDYENIHHRNETIAGLGDPWASVKTAWKLGPLLVGGRLGLTVPLGRTEENPFALAREGHSHQHVQLGSGTFDPVLGLELGLPLGKYLLRAHGQALLVLYENEKGFRAGHRFLGGLLGEGPIVGELRGTLAVDLANEQPERWEGKIEEEGNLGRTELLVGAALSYPVGSVRLSVGVKVPVYQRLIVAGHHGGQLSYPAIVTVGIQQLYGAATGRTP